MLKKALFASVAISMVAFVIAGCGGGGAVIEQNPADQTADAFPLKAPEIELDKGTATHEGAHGSYYVDPVEDEFDFGGFDFPIEWENAWPKGWGGYSDSSFDEWCLVFDYGDPVEGNNYVWVDAEIVYGDYDDDPETGDNYYMYFSFADVPTNAPGESQAGYDEDGAFYGFSDAAVHFWLEGDREPRNAGQFDFKMDLTSPDTDPAGKVPYDDFDLIDGEVYLPLFDGGKKGGADYDPTFIGMDFYIAIHATVAYIDYVEQFDEEGVSLGYDHVYQTPKMDDTGWGVGCPWEAKGSVLFEPFERVQNAAHPYGNIAYWRVNFTPDGNYPWPGPDSNPFAGWCTDPTGYQNNLNVRLISCYDPILEGTYAESDHYDLISWMINERNDPGSPYYNYNYGYFQRAVWYFKYGNQGGMHLGSGGPGANYASTHPMVAPLIADAKANGENYVPGPGEYFAVLLIPVDGNGDLKFGTSQVNIIEVDP